jgi:hypothetical protein
LRPPARAHHALTDHPLKLGVAEGHNARSLTAQRLSRATSESSPSWTAVIAVRPQQACGQPMTEAVATLERLPVLPSLNAQDRPDPAGHTLRAISVNSGMLNTPLVRAFAPGGAKHLVTAPIGASHISRGSRVALSRTNQRTVSQGSSVFMRPIFWAACVLSP